MPEVLKKPLRAFKSSWAAKTSRNISEKHKRSLYRQIPVVISTVKLTDFEQSTTQYLTVKGMDLSQMLKPLMDPDFQYVKTTTAASQ